MNAKTNAKKYVHFCVRFLNGKEMVITVKESRNLEFKESITNTFLKTVSAFSNYGKGKIVFGVKDDGTVCGIKNAEEVIIDIENRINDSISPAPDYTIAVDEKNQTITLTVEEGMYKPYLYKSKAYKRNDTATVETDRMELSRLILEGKNLSFDQIHCNEQEFSFKSLENALVSVLGIKCLSSDILKTLQLFSDDEGYSNAAGLLADNNNFSGIDVIRFGDSINIIRDRINLSGISVLDQFEKAMDVYRKYYQYEEISGELREKHETVPEKAFREAVANAIVHRTWDINSNIRISMYDDHIEIISPGGLPSGISKEEYLEGQVSVMRNPIIGNVFFRLHIIEQFGTGIRRIIESYRGFPVSPSFQIFENSIKIILPVLDMCGNMNENEMKVYMAVKGKSLSSSEISARCGFGKTRTVAVLKNLVSGGYVKVSGTGRGTRYSS